MNDRAKFPSLELYPLHDKDGFLEFVLGMWFNTRHLAGKPELREVYITLGGPLSRWPAQRIRKLVDVLKKTEQVEVPF